MVLGAQGQRVQGGSRSEPLRAGMGWPNQEPMGRRELQMSLVVSPGPDCIPGLHGGAGHAAGGVQGAHPPADAAGTGL